ncbi:MAG: GPP34 family phosphoprotein [Candidatus Eisenbacteria bacterium]|nr:GPP34 family phosphoprotein [Candidatus Eisenbacteria bacterium]
MREKRNLHLHEEILLLALRDKKGTTEIGSCYPMAMGGAVIAELILGGRVKIEESRWKSKLITLKDGTPFGDPVLDEFLGKIARSKRRSDVKSWVSRIAHWGKLKKTTAEGLRRKGILRKEEGKVLGIFPTTRWPERDPRPEKALVDRLRRAIVSDARALDPRTAILIGLTKRGNLLGNVIDKRVLKDRKKRIERIAKGEMVARETGQAIDDAVAAAVMVAVIIPVIASSAATGGS